MKVFDYLADRQTLIFNLFNKIRKLSDHDEIKSSLSRELYKLEIKLMEEITKYLNTQFKLFKQLGELGYEEILRPMFIYRFDVRKMLLVLHEHQENYQSPESIGNCFKTYSTDMKSLSYRFRECAKKDNLNFSKEFQTILKKVEHFNPDFYSMTLV